MICELVGRSSLERRDYIRRVVRRVIQRIRKRLTLHGVRDLQQQHQMRELGQEGLALECRFWNRCVKWWRIQVGLQQRPYVRLYQ